MRTDNGTEFTSIVYRKWCEDNGIMYSEPGKPIQNGYIERFNRTFREDVLDAYLLSSLKQFQIIRIYGELIIMIIIPIHH